MATEVLASGFLGAMSLGLDVVQGHLRLTAVQHGVRQDLVLTASDGLQLVWQQILVQRDDAVEIELVRLDPAGERGSGRGTHHFRNFMLWCEVAGIARVSLDAGKSVGGYFWARCGFIPDPASWRRMCEAWQSQAQRSGDAMLIKLVDSAMDLGPIGIRVVAKSRYGKSLLLNAQWHGLLDLTNPVHHAHAREYVHPTNI